MCVISFKYKKYFHLYLDILLFFYFTIYNHENYVSFNTV
jgi:hypothetical protein